MATHSPTHERECLMNTIEQAIISLLLMIFDGDSLNLFLRDPRSVAILAGGMIAICGALLGTFLLLRQMALTSDAISHTVLLGIVVAFLLMTGVFGLEADLSSPLLIMGATLAGMATVLLTEFIYKSGLVKQDSALGLAFPLLFAISIILVSRYTNNVHLDTDSVLMGDIGLAWADSTPYCFAECETVTITPEHPRAQFERTCINCATLGISPRDTRAEFSQVCANCGTYTAIEAWSQHLIDSQPTVVFVPKALSTLFWLTLLTVGFVVVFYKELKLVTFDSALAHALGFRPTRLHYTLMGMVSLVAVGAFQAVGSILVIAFFILPAATAYLLTDRLSRLLFISPVLGVIGALLGYELAYALNTSISASMVLAMFGLFCSIWVISPRYGLISGWQRRQQQRTQFTYQVVLGHLYHHENTPEAETELAYSTLNEHFNWSIAKMSRIIEQLRALHLITISQDRVILTESGRVRVQTFLRETLHRLSSDEQHTP